MNQEDIKALQLIDHTPEEGINHITDANIVPSNFQAIIQSVMSEAQWRVLAGRTPPHLIKKRPGKGQKTFSYVPHGYVTSVLNRCFGFDWDFEILPQSNGDMFKYLEEVIGKNYKDEDYQVRPASVIVHGRLTVRVRNPRDPSQVIAEITKSSTGEKEAIRGMTWGGLIKSAESDAFKKAASRLGVALDLYWQDMDEDYLSDFVGEIDPKREEMQGFVDGGRLEGKSDSEIAKALREAYPDVGYPQIAKLLGVGVGEVSKWCSS